MWLVCALLALPAVSLAHDDHQSQILRLDSELHNKSSDLDDFVHNTLKRADLHRRERNWMDALADYDQASRLDPDNRLALLGRAQVYLDSKNYPEALHWSGQLLVLQENHFQAGLIHARAARVLKQYDTALAYFKRSVDQMERPTPEIIIEYAQTMLESGWPDAQVVTLSIIDQEAKALSFPVNLDNFALQLEKSAGDLASALSRVNAVLKRHDNLLEWELERIELLIGLSRYTNARAFSTALTEKITSLTAQRKNSRAVQALVVRHNEIVSRLPGDHDSPG